MPIMQFQPNGRSVMNLKHQRFLGLAGVCLILTSLEVIGETAEYVCMGSQRGQIAIVRANSLLEANQIAKAAWGAAGCYKK
ncbi:hypothetical protein PS865_00337 [Pseudomonas fluorescens]|nr:hypothetical protein PS865_00337 [Pseudomonas fluorescens]